jgi:hypothetical protein
VDGGVSRAFDTRIDKIADDGCAFILEDRTTCGGPRRPGSPYCQHHHTLCHIPGGSKGERRRLRETEALANAVGGRQGRPARTPPDPFLRRLENITRGFLQPNCSRIVRRDGE